MKQLAIIIPCYNEENGIGNVIDSIPRKRLTDIGIAVTVIVIDNKSLYRENLLMFLDFHGHSTKKNVFVYGPEFPII